MTPREREIRDLSARVKFGCEALRDYSLGFVAAGLLEPILKESNTMHLANYVYVLAGLGMLGVGLIISPYGEAQ